MELALCDIQAGAEDPEWPPLRLTLPKVRAANPGHPANLASRVHEAEVHLNLTFGCPADSRLILFPHPGQIVSMDARECSLDGRRLNSGKSKHRSGLRRVEGTILFEIDSEGADARRLV